MGGDRTQLVNNDSSSESLFLDEGGSSATERADCWRSVDSGVPESSISQELTDRIHYLLGLGSMKMEGLIDRIQLQYKVLHENNGQSLEDARQWINRYRPGDGIHKVGGICNAGYAIPEASTLLIVGCAGAGKSCLVNNMIRVLNDVTDGFDRAQTYVDTGNGSLFLQEYFPFADAKHFCVFDSRGFSSTNISEDLDVIKRWMLGGICHGEAVCRPSDSKIIREAFEGRGRQAHSDFSVRRRVDYVIFVVNAFTVHRMRESHGVAALENLATLYKSPFLSFKDDAPMVVMTHGDMLAPQDRVFTRIFVGELLGVSPVDQIFDISCFKERSVHPGDVDTVNDLVLLNMLKFSLERADKNLPYKTRAASLSADKNLPYKTRVASLSTKIYGAIRDSWNNLGSGRLLLIVILSWLLSAFFMLIFLDSKSNPAFRNVGGKFLRKVQKKFRRHQARRL